jgi:hypothetical protein
MRADADPVVECKVVEVTLVRFRRGAGVEGDPIRIVTAYFDRDGDWLAENDAWTAPTVRYCPTCGHLEGKHTTGGMCFEAVCHCSRMAPIEDAVATVGEAMEALRFHLNSREVQPAGPTEDTA